MFSYCTQRQRYPFLQSQDGPDIATSDRKISLRQYNVSMSWHAHAMGKLLTHATCQLLSLFPQRILSVANVKEIVDSIDRALICPGNPDPEMVELFERRGDSIITADNYHSMQAV